MTSNWCKSFSLYWLTVVFKLLIDNFFTTMCNFLYLPSTYLENICVNQHELFRIENLFKLKKNSMKLSMSCEQTVGGVWTKIEEVLKSLGSKSSSYPTKVTSERMRRICSTVEMYQTFEMLLYQRLWEKFEVVLHICWGKIFEMKVFEGERISCTCFERRNFCVL